MFYSEPTLRVEFFDGVRDLFLNYSSHEIMGDVLKITMKEIFYNIEVDLYYRVFDYTKHLPFHL